VVFGRDSLATCRGHEWCSGAAVRAGVGWGRGGSGCGMGRVGQGLSGQ